MIQNWSYSGLNLVKIALVARGCRLTYNRAEVEIDLERAAQRGLPSYLWRFGQERRLALILRYAPLSGQAVLDVGCGVGTFLHRFREYTASVYGVDLETENLREAQGSSLHNLACAQAEALPFPDNHFGVILLHEVLEHTQDDHQALAEAYRVTKTGGRIVIFVPNRLYPFETHGIFWRGRYRFGNFPLVNYLPNLLRRRFAPHVRAYTPWGLRRLLDGLKVKIVVHIQIFPGYDRIATHRPWLASILRRTTYFLEHTPLRLLGLSHFLVLEKLL